MVSVNAVCRRAVGAPKSSELKKPHWHRREGRAGGREGGHRQSQQPGMPQLPMGVCFSVDGARLSWQIRGLGREQCRELQQGWYGRAVRKGFKATIPGFPLHFSPRAMQVLSRHCVWQIHPPLRSRCVRVLWEVWDHKVAFYQLLDQCRGPSTARSCSFLYRQGLGAAAFLPLGSACWFWLSHLCRGKPQWQQGFPWPVVFTPKKRRKKTHNDNKWIWELAWTGLLHSLSKWFAGVCQYGERVVANHCSLCFPKWLHLVSLLWFLSNFTNRFYNSK